MNLILFELRRMRSSLCLMVLISMGMPLMLVVKFAGDDTEKFLALMIPVTWLLIAFNAASDDREQAALLGGMPVTLRRAFLTRLLVRLAPVIVLTAVFWRMIGIGGFRSESLEFAGLGSYTPVDFGGLILAGVGVAYFLQSGNLRPEMSVGKMIVLISALFLQPAAKLFYQIFSGEYAFFLTCVQMAVLAFIGSWEIWRAVYLNGRFRWRTVLLMLLPVAQWCIADVFFILEGGQ